MSNLIRQNDVHVRVRYSETDAMGFLHHSRYFALFEVGRTELYRVQGGDYRAMEESGLFLVVAKAECRFRSPARYDDELIIRTTLSRASPAKLEHDYEVIRGGVVLATGHTVLGCVDRQGQIQRMPDFLVDGFEVDLPRPKE